MITQYPLGASAMTGQIDADLSGDAFGRDVYTVSRLNREARALIEDAFDQVWVEGELSNLARPRSGHIYFSLKDEQAQVRCAMFKGDNRHLDFEPRDGQQVLIQARASLYPARGDFQLIANYMEEAGAGALRRAFEALKRKLYEEGLFDDAHKQALPPLPMSIGVITSPTGAALKDVLAVLGRRHPGARVIVYPTPVQGEQAPRQIVQAIETAGERHECDVLLLVRGGGSLEDLWPFNDESVARAIHACPLPLVAGIGHEVDISIADFVADRRAPTPSVAAEVVVPDMTQTRARVRQLRTRLDRRLRRWVADSRQRTEHLARRLVHPKRRLAEQGKRLAGLNTRLRQSARTLKLEREARLRTALARLARFEPTTELASRRALVQVLEQRLHTAGAERIRRDRARLTSLTRALEALSPNNTLARGYAIITRREDGAVIRAAGQTQKGEALQARLASGRIEVVVDKTHE